MKKLVVILVLLLLPGLAWVAVKYKPYKETTPQTTSKPVEKMPVAKSKPPPVVVPLASDNPAPETETEPSPEEVPIVDEPPGKGPNIDAEKNCDFSKNKDIIPNSLSDDEYCKAIIKLCTAFEGTKMNPSVGDNFYFYNPRGLKCLATHFFDRAGLKSIRKTCPFMDKENPLYRWKCDPQKGIIALIPPAPSPRTKR